jgi:hypothetical protein
VLRGTKVNGRSCRHEGPGAWLAAARSCDDSPQLGRHASRSTLWVAEVASILSKMRVALECTATTRVATVMVVGMVAHLMAIRNSISPAGDYQAVGHAIASRPAACSSPLARPHK